MNTDVSYKQECFRKVLNCLKNNKVMVDTRDDGIYIRLAGNEDKGEAFTLHFANAYPFDKPEQPVMAQYPNEKNKNLIYFFIESLSNVVWKSEITFNCTWGCVDCFCIIETHGDTKVLVIRPMSSQDDIGAKKGGSLFLKFKNIPSSPEPTKEEQPLSNFEKEIASVINRFSRENMSDTPDFILATYLNNCLNAYEKATQQKKNWFR